MFTLICARINGWVNNREADDLRRYRAHYDVIVMSVSWKVWHVSCRNMKKQMGWLFSKLEQAKFFRKIWILISSVVCEVGARLMIRLLHYGDVIMDVIASQITSLTIVYSIVYSDADQRKHQSSASLAFVRGIHRGPVNSPQKWPVTRKMFPFHDIIMQVPKIVSQMDEKGGRKRVEKEGFDSTWMGYGFHIGNFHPGRAICLGKIFYFGKTMCLDPDHRFLL